MAQVVLEKVSKLWPGGVRAVDGVDLHIRDREFIVLVGPSGCGKSTTLRMVAGLEEISAGTIRIGERIVNDIAPKDRDIAMVFQNYALYPHMTVYKNMAFGLKLRGMPRAQIHERVMAAATKLEITHLLDRKPKALSGGQRQRVAVGRAIVREPSAFLFDEPLSNLDAKLRVTTRAELKRLHQQLRTTTIYVTHDQEEAMTLGDRIVVMKDGRIQQADAPLVTYNLPANRFVAGFIGMPPMNFFDGILKLATGAAASQAAGEMVFEEGKNSGGELTLPGNGFTLSVPVKLRDRLSGQVGRHVVLGIRPEHFHLRKDALPPDAAVPLVVKMNVVEPLGNDMDIYMDTALHSHVVGRVEATVDLALEAHSTVYVDARRLHFFEPGETGMNLTLSGDNQFSLSSRPASAAGGGIGLSSAESAHAMA
jgi:multiple sugar transport system ATP-binding protein